MSKKPDLPVTIDQFTGHPQVLEIIRQMQQKFGASYEKLVVSDLLDENGNQYVNLVQEGGGVLGVALVGYTYILEQAGIRFFRLAGTSAGAINTTMIAVIGNKGTAKSMRVLEYLCNKNLFDFVDGHPFAKKLIGNLITSKGYFGKIKRRLFGLLKIISILLLIDFISIGLHKYYPGFSALYITGFVLTGFAIGIVGLIAGLTVLMISSFKIPGSVLTPAMIF